MLRLAFILVLLVAGTCQAWAEIIISGKVTDASGEPLAALVTIISGKKVEGYGLADGEGRYSISFAPSTDMVTVKVALMGYETVEKSVAAKTQRLDMTMTEGSIELTEVTVVSDNITQRGDTLSYQVGAYKDASDRVIGDVIKKMPGLEVSDAGRISFNGKTVKNFYVEDMDLLEGRYGIATNNISANDVASVQVYQNHQPVRALQNWAPSDDVTINIKLKSSARGTVSLSGMAAAGYKPAMWAAEAVAMYFGKKGQTITTYKGNNSGDNVTAELSHLTDAGPMKFFNNAPLSVVSPGVPGVARKRYLLNRSNTVSTSNVFKLDSLTTLNFSMAYLDDIIRNNGASTTEQYLPTGGYRLISQKISTKSHIHNLTASATYKKNTSALYLTNMLNVKAGWDKDFGTSMTTASFMDRTEAVGQALDNPSVTIDDKISVIKNSRTRALSLDVAFGWNHRPQTLTVGPASIFGQSNASDEVCQQYTTDDFRAEARTGMSFRIGKLILDMLAFGTVDVEAVTSQLDGFSSVVLPATANDYTFGKGDAGIEPRLAFNAGEFHFEFRFPLSYSAQWLRDRLDTERNRAWNFLNFIPACKATYRLGKSWWELNSSFYRMRDNSGRVATGTVMTDYLSFRQYLIDMTMVDKTWYTTLDYHYSNAMSQLFANATAGWLRSSQNSMTGYDYDGLVTVRNVYDLPYVSNRYTATASINKGLSFWESTLKLGSNYSLYRSKQLINKTPVDYRAQYWSANLMFAATPAPWMGVALGLAYSENRSYTELTKADALTVRQWTGRIDVNVYPLPALVLNLSAENNYTNLTDTDRRTWFGDAKVIYRYKRLDWELDFNNIFNRKEFARVHYSGMDIYKSTFTLRPRSLMLRLRLKLL